MYAAQARQPPVVPFSPEEVSRRRTAEARGTNRGSAINPNRRAPGVAPACRGGNIGMPPIPARAERRPGQFDIAKELKSMKLSITCAELIKQSPGLRQDLLELVADMDEDDQDEHMARGNRPPAQSAARAPGAAAPRIRSRPAAPVPFTFPNNSAPSPPPAGLVHFTFPNQAAQGPVPMETHLDTEIAYHTNSQANPERQMYCSSFINTVVEAPVVLCGHTFEGILDTSASGTAVSHAVVRGLGFMSIAAKFSTAGGGTEARMGVLEDFPIQIGFLMLKIDAMVTPADNYTIFVGNDWLRMAESDLLLSKGVLRVRLNTDQVEDIPIDTAVARRPTSIMWHPPEPLIEEAMPIVSRRQMECLSRLVELRQLSIRAEDMMWRRYPELPITTIWYRDPMLEEAHELVHYDIAEARRVTGFQGKFHWNKLNRTELQCYKYDYKLHLAQQSAQRTDPNQFADTSSDSLPKLVEVETEASETGQSAGTAFEYLSGITNLEAQATAVTLMLRRRYPLASQGIQMCHWPLPYCLLRSSTVMLHQQALKRRTPMSPMQSSQQ